MIESITLQGFKSFSERTRLEFGPGVSAVIGPNGSGKSNVVEALRWATHQARARELRAMRASELIFHGSGSKAPLGLAEVQLELRTISGPLNLSRRLYQDGTAEQDIAGRPARVRDVHAALRGTGLGPGGLAVIGQGEVSGVVQAEGRVLLGYLQEAAGLSRSVSARHDTEQRLQTADQALSELQLILDELSSRVRQLAVDADAARLHRALSLRELALAEALHRARQEALKAEWHSALSKAAQLEQQASELAAQTLTASAHLEAATLNLRSLRQAQMSHLQAQELLEAARNGEAQVRRTVQHLERERADVQRELAALTLRSPAEAEPDPAPMQVQLAQLRAELTQAEAQRRPLEQELSRVRQMQAQQREGEARLSTRRAALDAELGELILSLDTGLPALEAARAELAAAAAERLSAEQLALERRQARADLQAQQALVGRELAEVRAARAPLSREQTRLDDLLSSYTRYGEGPRHALISQHPGLVGSVADLLTVSAEYQVAASAALGRRVEQVVVRRAEDARELIELLKRKGGRATFLPLDLLRPRPRRDAGLLREDGVLGNLAELCPSEPPQVAEALLEGTLLVRDLGAATRLARRHASRPRLVTLNGELLEPGGALTGGRQHFGGANVLADQRRAQELASELAELSRREAQLQASEQRLSSQLAALPVPPSASDQTERQAERRLTQLETARQAALVRREAVQTRRAELEGVGVNEIIDLASLEARLTELDAALTEQRHRERQHSEALARARELVANWALYRAAAAQQLGLEQRLTANAAALEEQREALARAEGEAMRRAQEEAERRPQGLSEAEALQATASREYANLLARQNKLQTELADTRLLAARREGSLEVLPDGALLPGTPRDHSAEQGRVRDQLAELGLINARAETEHAQEAARLEALNTEHADAAQAAAELRGHLAQLTHSEAQASAEAFARVNAAFAEYSRELLGGLGELEAEWDAEHRLCGLRLSVQPRGKRTRSLNLLSTGERTMAGLGFLFALNVAAPGAAGGLPLAVLDEVDAPLDEANIRRFTHFLEVFAARGAQFVLVTHQRATMEVARAIWGVTTENGASRVLSIKQGEAG